MLNRMCSTAVVQKRVGHQLPDLAVHNRGAFESEMDVGPLARTARGAKCAQEPEQQEHDAVGDEQLFHRAGEGRKTHGHGRAAWHGLLRSVHGRLSVPAAVRSPNCDGPWHRGRVQQRLHCSGEMRSGGCEKRATERTMVNIKTAIPFRIAFRLGIGTRNLRQADASIT